MLVPVVLLPLLLLLAMFLVVLLVVLLAVLLVVLLVFLLLPLLFLSTSGLLATPGCVTTDPVILIVEVAELPVTLATRGVSIVSILAVLRGMYLLILLDHIEVFALDGQILFALLLISVSLGKKV
jgi:hypothetical protein